MFLTRSVKLPGWVVKQWQRSQRSYLFLRILCGVIVALACRRKLWTKQALNALHRLLPGRGSWRQHPKASVLQEPNSQECPPPPSHQKQQSVEQRKSDNILLPSRARGRNCAAYAVPGYAAGVRAAYRQRYNADLERLQKLVPPDARWIDSHCHLESILERTWKGGQKPLVMDNEEPMNLEELLASWPAGLEGCICNIAFQRLSEPWGRLSEWDWIDEMLPLLEPGSLLGSKMWFTIGLHPSDSDRWDSAAEMKVRKLLNHPRCVGIGECGLDFSFRFKGDEVAEQTRAFRAQAALAVETGKALVVHAREAEDRCFEVLRDVVPPNHPIHMHCFTDSLQHALQLCNTWENLCIGFTGCITFGSGLEEKSKGKGRGKGKGKSKGKTKNRDRPDHFIELVRGLPVSKLLIETDGPYMCPEPFRGQTAHPGHVHRVAERIAELKGIPLPEVMAATRRNCKVVYGI